MPGGEAGAGRFLDGVAEVAYAPVLVSGRPPRPNAKSGAVAAKKFSNAPSSRRKRTRRATMPATRCCAPLPSGCRPRLRPMRSSVAWAATNSRYSFLIWTTAESLAKFVAHVLPGILETMKARHRWATVPRVIVHDKASYMVTSAQKPGRFRAPGPQARDPPPKDNKA